MTFWKNAELRQDTKHFMGKEFPEGTPVQFRTYERDETYIEVLLPDGSMLTMLPENVCMTFDTEVS